MKPGQRKVLFTCLKRNLVKELKVAQLAGSVAELSAYHHGETSLMGTCILDAVGSKLWELTQLWEMRYGSWYSCGKCIMGVDTAVGSVSWELSQLSKVQHGNWHIFKYFSADSIERQDLFDFALIFCTGI